MQAYKNTSEGPLETGLARVEGEGWPDRPALQGPASSPAFGGKAR